MANNEAFRINYLKDSETKDSKITIKFDGIHTETVYLF